MISRSLGPEFGGSIGLMFFLAKVCACGEYVLGLVEAILDVFGSDPGKFLVFSGSLVFFLLLELVTFVHILRIVRILHFVPVCLCYRVVCVRGGAGAPSGLLVHGAVLVSGPSTVSDCVSGGRPHLLAHRLRHPAGDHCIFAVYLNQFSGGQTSRFCDHPQATWQPDRPLQRQLHGLQCHHSEEQPGL